MKTYRVRAEREGKFWLLTVPERDVMTQARRLTEADEMARDLIATWLDIAPDSFAIDLDVALPDELAERRDRARQLREEADRLRDRAAEELRLVVRDAHAAGLSVRELAVALGVSSSTSPVDGALVRHAFDAVRPPLRDPPTIR